MGEAGGIGGVGYALFLAVRAAVHGNYLTTILVVGLTVAPILVGVILAISATGGTRTRTTSDPTGFTVWPDRRYGPLYLTGLAITGPCALLLAFLVPRGLIDLPMTRGMQLIKMPVLLWAVAAVALGGLMVAAQRRVVGYLKFTPAMVEVANALKTRVLEWDDIIDIKDHPEKKRTGRSAVLCLRDGTEEIIGALTIYVPTGVPLYWMIRHYWKHPEDRMELVDSRAAERLQDGRFSLD
ncbi:hypothetical protein MPHLCCUG_01101 [Mycolicibacterium phlei]|nr:hypothetical protein MPHLCCUG_01101 [Mycolicibacterium phlei]